MLDITARSYHYDDDFRAWIATRPISELTLVADGYRKTAADPKHGTGRDLALAAYYQFVIDDKTRRLVFLPYHPEEYVDQGGPCGHSSPDGMFDDCLCRDGWHEPAYIADGLTFDYCDGEPADRLLARPHAEHCEHYRTDPWMPF